MLRLLLATALALGGTVADAQDLAPPFGLTFERDGDGPLSGLLRLRDAEADYRAAGDDSAEWSQYTQVRAFSEAAVGDHAAALRWFDATMGGGRDSVGTLPDGIRAVGAAEYVADRVADEGTRVVMVNEPHHDASGRLLTLELLPLLYEQGFRYLAAETFNIGDAELNARGYAVDSSGVYSRETVFAALIREAARLGYTLVPYEIEPGEDVEDDTLSYQQRRDYEQARHLAERTVERDPDARVLVHAGYAHINESPTERWYPMGAYFRERTGIDALTVSQTTVEERSRPALEHPDYRAADAAGLLGPSPTVLLLPDGTPFAPTERSVDVQVFRPRAGDVDGRPAWLAAIPNRVRMQVEVPPCPQTCELAARLPGESPDAVPIDRVATTGGTVSLYVPESDMRLELRDGRTGERIRLGPFPVAPPSPRPDR